MSDHKKGQSTGPKTADGKAVSSQNARKDAIFVQGYLPWENAHEKEQQFAALVKQWGAKDPSRLMLLRTLEQCQLGIERMMDIERKKIAGLMQSTTIAYDFCERAGLAPALIDQLPNWFFLADDQNQKRRARHIAQIYDEAADLKARYSDLLVARAKDEFPALYAHVMHGQKEGASFLMVLGKTYAQSMPTLNLAVLMNKLHENYEYHLLWCQDPERYQTIIDGLRAEQIEQALDLDKSQRYATNLQNRMLKGFSALVALDQHERMIKSQNEQTGPAQLAPPNSERKAPHPPDVGASD